MVRSEVLSRFNMYNSIAISGTVADGYSTGDAIKAIEEVAEQVLPKGYGYDFGGLTREESQTGSNTAIIFGICIILIYLILSALYESFLIPFAVILAVRLLPCFPKMSPVRSVRRPCSFIARQNSYWATLT